jgi:hypothetical protein
MANTYTLISSVTVGAGGAAGMAFTSIPSTYTDLLIKLTTRTTGAGGADVSLKFNSATTNYSYRDLEGTGSSAASYNGTSFLWAGEANRGDATASTFANIEIYVPNYAGSNYKSISVDSVTENNGTLAYADLLAGLWSNTSAITAIDLILTSGNHAQYSTAYLYGISNA